MKKLDLAFYVYDLNHDGMIDPKEAEIIIMVDLYLLRFLENKKL